MKYFHVLSSRMTTRQWELVAALLCTIGTTMATAAVVLTYWPVLTAVNFVLLCSCVIATLGAFVWMIATVRGARLTVVAAVLFGSGSVLATAAIGAMYRAEPTNLLLFTSVASLMGM